MGTTFGQNIRLEKYLLGDHWHRTSSESRLFRESKSGHGTIYLVATSTTGPSHLLICFRKGIVYTDYDVVLKDHGRAHGEQRLLYEVFG